MKHLLIIGARGFGREVFNTAIDSIGYGTEFEVKGFLDDNSKALDGYVGYPAIIDSVENYIPEDDDVFICALGDVKYKKKYISILSKYNPPYINIIHKDAIVGKNSVLGKGCVVSTGVRISCDVKVGDFVTINDYAVVGHDAIVGDYCHLNSYSFMGGFSELANDVTIHTGAIITPHVKVGEGSLVGAGAVVLRNVKPSCTMIGNPARVLNF